MHQETKLEKSYRLIFIIIITAGLTFVITTVLLMYLIANDKLIIKDVITNNTVSVSSFNKLERTLEIIKKKYINKDLDMNKLEEAAISGMLSEVGDKYTRYITKEEYDNMMSEGNGTYLGLGIVVTFNTDKKLVEIINVTFNSPAEKAGILAGDYIEKVDNEVVTSDNYSKLIDTLKGTEKTSSEITLIRGTEKFTKVINKENVEATSVYHKVINNNLGYIQITGFNVQSGKQFKAAYDDLMSKGVKGVILDLRNNPGGILSETMEIAEVILPKGIVMYTEDRDGNREDKTTKDDNQIEVPLTVLVNGRSASASEVITGAIKDFGKGTIIGTNTYGKGIVQAIYEYGDGSALSYTYSEYHTKSGKKIHGVGIAPDIQVEVPQGYENKVTIPEDIDTQLKKAIEILNK